MSAIHVCMGNYLKMAPYREGGAGKGCRVPGSAFGVSNDLEGGNIDADSHEDVSQISDH